MINKFAYVNEPLFSSYECDCRLPTVEVYIVAVVSFLLKKIKTLSKYNAVVICFIMV